MEVNKIKLFRFLNRYTNIHSPSGKKNVFIFSMPRSGSTWLLQLIWTQKGFKYCNEPLNIKGEKFKKISRIFSWEELYNKNSKDKIISYFKNHCEGKIKSMNPTPLSRNYNFFTNRMVFKIIHGGEIFINDIINACNGKVVYLIRHPIPVALSRKYLPRLDVLCSEPILNEFSQAAQQLARKVYKDGDYLDKAVLSWCIQNSLALRDRRPDWLVITYEQVVVNPEPVIKKMVKVLDLDDEKKMINQLQVPSKVTKQSGKEKLKIIKENEQGSHKMIDLWRSKVDPRKEKELFKIVNAFDLGNIYSSGSSYPGKEFLI